MAKLILHADYASTDTPLDSDRVLVGQNYATTPVSKHISNTTYKAFLKTYFDTLYATTQNAYTTADFSKTSDTTLANVTGLTANVVAAGVYRFRANLVLSCDASGGAKVALSGTCTKTNLNATVIRAPASSPVASNITALDASSGGTAAYVNISIDGSIVVNQAGTLTVQFAQNASFATASIVLLGSTFTVTKIG